MTADCVSCPTRAETPSGVRGAYALGRFQQEPGQNISFAVSLEAGGKEMWLSDCGEAEHELKGPVCGVLHTKEIGRVAKENILLLQFLLFRACEGSL